MFKIVLVGLDKTVNKKGWDDIITIHRTKNQHELASIYAAADVYVNPTREDNYPIVNMEALSCGTPVITFNNGGSPEMIDNSCRRIVTSEDINGMEKAIKEILTDCSAITREACLKKSLKFDPKECFERYAELYKKIAEKKIRL